MSIAPYLAEPALWKWKEKEWRVHPWTFEIQAAFEKWLERHAIDSYRRVAQHLSQEEADKALSSLLRDIAAGALGFGGEFAQKTLSAPVHVKRMFFLCIRKNHTDATPELVEEMAKDDYGGMIQAMNLANTDPNKRRGAKEDAIAPPPQEA